MMKKVYETPDIIIERYELNKSIASNCATVVSNGPEVPGHEQGEDYDNPFGNYSMARRSKPYNVSFYDDQSCDCYYTASGNGYWTS